jgi:hypothetical protein
MAGRSASGVPHPGLVLGSTGCLCGPDRPSAARGFRTATNFIHIAYLRLSKLTDLPASPFAPAMPR